MDNKLEITSSNPTKNEFSSVLSSSSMAQSNNEIILNNHLFHFGFIDYSFFVLLLSLSAIIGIYYGFFSKHKQNTTSEYILGGRSMKILPVATSMIATHISGSTLVGLPSEVYANGTQYVMFVVPAIMVGLCLSYIYLPLFHTLNVTSSFDYLERRFDRRIRLVASCVYTVKHIFFSALVIFVPALGFSEMTGINLHFVTPVICAICIFYTALGGLRAVVWTDFIQFILMLAAIITVIALGVNEVGGLSNVWMAAERGHRLIIFNMDPSPFARTSFWAMSLGLTVNWLSGSGVGQATVQRFLSVPDLHAARRSVVFFVLGMIFIKMLALLLGLCIYAHFEHCDPIQSGLIKKSDEIVTLFLGQVGQKLPGIAGLFTAGICAAGLSSMSSTLNTLSGSIYDDFFKSSKHTEKHASNLMKWITIMLGVMITLLVFLVEKLGSIFQVGLSISGTCMGAYLGIFTIGMSSRTVNSKGIIAGVTVSVALVTVIMVGGQYYNVSKASTLPVQTDGCPERLMENVQQINSTILNNQIINDTQSHEEIFWLFRISFMYYAFIGFIITMCVSQMVSLVTGGAEQNIDESLLTPLFQSRQFKAQQKLKRNETKYVTIDQMLVDMKKQQDSDRLLIDNDDDAAAAAATAVAGIDTKTKFFDNNK